MTASRRKVLGAASGALAGAAMLGSAGSAQASGGRRQPTFVVVNGANGGADGLNGLALRGLRSVGVTLPGHAPAADQFRRAYQAPQDLAALATVPSPMAGVTLDDYANATIDVVRKVARFGPVILVSFSMGGHTVTAVANRVPHLIDRVVYSSAFCCVDLPNPMAYLGTEEGSTTLLPTMAGGAIGDPAVIGATRMNWRSADPGFLDAARKAMMAEGTDAEFYALLAGLEPDESIHVSLAEQRIDPARWGRVRHTYIRHTLDRCIPLALQDRMIAEADARTPGNRFDVRSVETGHCPSEAKMTEIFDILASLA